jgi:glycosyltransferase involved in cell wall biosynthesis
VKFLLVNHEYPPVGAGAATAIEAIARNLSALGHDVTVLTANYDSLPGCRTEEGVSVRRIKCIRQRPDRSNLFEMLTFLVVALLSLPSILRRDQPNGLIVFFSLPSGPIGAVAKIFFGAPYVVSLRGGDVPGLVPELNLLHKLAAPLRRYVLRHARALVSNSEGLRKLSEATDPYPVRVIPNGVDEEFFRPGAARSKASGSNSPLRILFVGRFQQQKNLGFLLRQLGKLPSGSFELHLVGDGPQQQSLEHLAERLRINKSIISYGWIPRAALPKIYQSVDCLVNPSLYEGMPNVVLEAMACGLPVVASKIPAHEALVLAGETGFLFDLHDPAELISALTQLRNVDLCRRLGACSSALAAQLFSWKNVASEYAKLFDAHMLDVSQA